MAQRIKTQLQSANMPLLDQQLRTVLTVLFEGVVADNTGLYLQLSESATQSDITQALSIAAAHDPQVDTPEQAAEKVGKVNVAALLSAADTALAQLAAKRTTFQSAQTLQNAAPLLTEVAQDLEGVIKALKYVLTRIQ